MHLAAKNQEGSVSRTLDSVWDQIWGWWTTSSVCWSDTRRQMRLSAVFVLLPMWAAQRLMSLEGDSLVAEALKAALWVRAMQHAHSMP